MDTRLKLFSLVLLLAIVSSVFSGETTKEDDENYRAVRAAVKLPTKCKETKYRAMCKFYKKVVPMYENVEIWRLKDQVPTVTFYGVRDQVVDDVPIWILPKEEWEVLFTDGGLKMKPEFAISTTTTTTEKPEESAKVMIDGAEIEVPVSTMKKMEL